MNNVLYKENEFLSRRATEVARMFVKHDEAGIVKSFVSIEERWWQQLYNYTRTILLYKGYRITKLIIRGRTLK